MKAGRALFEGVVERTGLASFIGPGAVVRSLASVGALPDEATVEDYRRALPQLRGRMSVYLSPPEVQQHVLAIEALLAS